MKTNTLHLLLVLMLLQSCQTSDTTETTFKHHPHDPFRETMVESQIFELNASQDNVTEGKHETLLVFPKGCFVNAEGKAVTGKVKVELADQSWRLSAGSAALRTHVVPSLRKTNHIPTHPISTK